MSNFLKGIKRYLRKKLPKTDLHGFEYTVTELVGMWENSKIASQWHGKILNNEILQYKKSDTIFILGSGPSIIDISPREWVHIGKHDSIGFNYWVAHGFVPNFYMLQINQDDDQTALTILEDKYSEYRDVPFLIRGSAFARCDFDLNNKRLDLLKKNPVYYVNEYPIAGRCQIDPFLLFKYMDALGFMKFGQICDFVPKWRSSLGLIIMLCYQMGYKKIVLCGMDMLSSDHFWDFQPYLEVKMKYSLPDVGTANLNSFTDPSMSLNTVPKYVYSLRDWMKEKKGVKIFVMKKRTVLYPEIELYPDTLE